MTPPRRDDSDRHGPGGHGDRRRGRHCHGGQQRSVTAGPPAGQAPVPAAAAQASMSGRGPLLDPGPDPCAGPSDATDYLSDGPEPGQAAGTATGTASGSLRLCGRPGVTVMMPEP